MTRSPQRPNRNARVIYDVLYGFIPVTEWEEQIINSPFFQRLRWIKQLGFANYIFPGAEHNRFAHVIGVMHSMDQMVRALGLAVSDNELFDPRTRSDSVMLHKSLRVAALLHDIGTFPFSHAIDNAYIRHGNDQRAQRKDSKKDLPNSHEHLGSFIIKNTDYDGGITRTLETYGFDVKMISKIIKGDSPHLIANQLMHSDLDADRMDYLLRDSHYTGIKYGQFDREYILANLTAYDAGPLNGKDQIAFGVRENAAHAVEDFLIARFHWYSQVIKNEGSAKFDIIATHIASGLLEQGVIYQFHDLLDMVESRDERFFFWNDIYFMNECQVAHYSHALKNPKLNELIEMLLFRKPPKTVRHPLFAHRILEDKEGEKVKLLKQIQSLLADFERVLSKNKRAWILADIPDKDVVFTRGINQIVKKRGGDNLYRERDPVKIVSKDGKPSLLVERESSLMRRLSGLSNFVPSVYANDEAVALLKSHHLIPS